MYRLLSATRGVLSSSFEHFSHFKLETTFLLFCNFEMKEFMTIWERLTGRQYSAVNTNANVDDPKEDCSSSIQNKKSLRRKSSVVVNQFFSAALPVHSDGRPKWPRSEFRNAKKVQSFSFHLLPFLQFDYQTLHENDQLKISLIRACWQYKVANHSKWQKMQKMIQNGK